VSGRPKEPDEPAHRIERVAFTTSRLMEFCTEKELVAQTGHESYEWPRVITKELVDNGIDACEEAEVSPSIKVTIKTGNAKSRRRPAKPTRVVIEDNGPGIPPETIAGIIDYNVRVSSREAYISPTRGRQGNALKSILPMAYLLGGEGKGETWIEARGIKHRILFSVNQIKQEPIIGHTTTRSKVTTGTRITVFWPAKATVEYQDEDDYTREGEATFQTDAIKDDLAKALNENKLLLSELHRLGVGAPTDDLVRINSVRALKTLLQSCPWNTREFESPPHFLSPGERKNFADLAQSWGQTILNQVAQRVPTEQPKTTTEAA